MRALLEFTLPEDSEEHELALKGSHYKSVIDDLDNWLRNMAKHEDKRDVEIEQVRCKIMELMRDSV